MDRRNSCYLVFSYVFQYVKGLKRKQLASWFRGVNLTVPVAALLRYSNFGTWKRIS